jgi:hypothetical protein
MNSDKINNLSHRNTLPPKRDKEIKHLNKAHAENLYNFSPYLHIYDRNNVGFKAGM